ncbi:hypothetical protein N431DRAFT_334045 [Stipitochalara longipes BDJ]|nr:hypothetical protein N431DRAFT_334045 [Stipitochalara longipes BDJ]
MGSAAPGFYMIDQSEYYLPPMMLLASGQVVDPNRAQRVAITPSMLFTYAHMRGRNQHYFDPLHHALYPAFDRYLFAHRMWLPPIARSTSLEGLPRGATYFWDPITCANLQPSQPLPPALHGGTYQPRRDERPQLTYNEFISQHPPTVGKNHYKGDMVWANFGYYLVDGKWVDPESEGELYNAYMKPSGNQRAELDFPDIARSRDDGPRIMSAQEQDMFYKEFAADVFDEFDGEGDPRAWRVTPETFAQWASGASTGDRYEESIIKAPEKRRPPQRSFAEKCRIPPKPQPQMQFDVDTGSVLSGAYEADTDPSLLSTPLGLLPIQVKVIQY